MADSVMEKEERSLERQLQYLSDVNREFLRRQKYGVVQADEDIEDAARRWRDRPWWAILIDKYGFEKQMELTQEYPPYELQIPYKWDVVHKEGNPDGNPVSPVRTVRFELIRHHRRNYEQKIVVYEQKGEAP